jgi:hypothetical protein
MLITHLIFTIFIILILLIKIASLHEAKQKANVARYKSDFTDDDEIIPIRNSPARSTISMPLFSGNK